MSTGRAAGHAAHLCPVQRPEAQGHPFRVRRWHVRMLLLDGRDIQSCNTRVSVVEGREVTTIEGLGGNTKRNCLENPLVDRRL